MQNMLTDLNGEPHKDGKSDVDRTVDTIREMLEQAVADGVEWTFSFQGLEFVGADKNRYRWGMLAGVVMVLTINPHPDLLDPAKRETGPEILGGSKREG